MHFSNNLSLAKVQKLTNESLTNELNEAENKFACTRRKNLMYVQSWRNVNELFAINFLAIISSRRHFLRTCCLEETQNGVKNDEVNQHR